MFADFLHNGVDVLRDRKILRSLALYIVVGAVGLVVVVRICHRLRRHDDCM